MTLRLHVNLPDMRRAVGRGWRAAGLPASGPLRQRVREAARATLARQGVADAELSITLLDDEAMRTLNRDYLERDRTTDVIAFHLGANEDDAVLGDVYIGVERGLAQAAELDVPPTEELTRLVVHGTLHVLGYDHPADDSRAHSAMWQIQEAIVRDLLPQTAG